MNPRNIPAPRSKSAAIEFGVHEPKDGPFPESLAEPRLSPYNEALRRAAFQRLARTIGISFLQCRREADGRKT